MRMFIYRFFAFTFVVQCVYTALAGTSTPWIFNTVAGPATLLWLLWDYASTAPSVEPALARECFARCRMSLDAGHIERALWYAEEGARHLDGVKP